MMYRMVIVMQLLPVLSAVGASGEKESDAPISKMTYAEAVSRIPDRALLDFWFGAEDGLSERFESLNRGQVTTIAESPGGRPVHLVTYGDRETVQHLANFNSAIGAREPAAYMDKESRTKPVILFVGPVHGHEVEALTGLVNLIHVMETGTDLRGTPQRDLQALGEQCRLLIVPAGNPDGVARFKPRCLIGMKLADLRFWGQGTWSDDSLCGWPAVKRLHPMQGEAVGFIGCYFNDAGINPMHDEFFAPMSAEAAAIVKVAAEEGPDLATSLHSHAQAPTVLRPAYVTTEVQERMVSLSAQYYDLLKARGLPCGNPFKVAPDGGKNPAPFNLASALYHVSGADVFTYECPHGLDEEDACQVNPDQILDIQLTLYESMMRFALDRKQSAGQ